MGRRNSDTLPEEAPDPVNCATGGKHKPRGVETVLNGVPAKYEACRKCGKRVGNRRY